MPCSCSPSANAGEPVEPEVVIRNPNHWPFLKAKTMNIIRICLALLFVLPSCCEVYGQIELSYTIRKTIVGATNAELLPGGRILIDDDSKISGSVVAEVRATSTKPYKFEAMKSLKEYATLIDLPDVVSGELTTKRFLLVGEGFYVFKATSRTDELDRTLEITIGKPGPPKPDDPPGPKPDDPPKPDIDVSNDYNVGKIAYTTAPADPAMAKSIAVWYRVGASKLFGANQEKLSDIESIKKDIDKQFAAKQCKDQPTCEQWAKWQVAVKAALLAEQNKRKTFTRQDWYTSYTEIANALEQVK